MLTPWECPGIFADDAPFAGHAKRQLEALSEIVQRDGSATSECAPPIAVSPAIRLRGCSPRGRRFKPTCLMQLRARRARCGTQTSRNTSRPSEFERPLRCAYFSLRSKEARTPSRLLRSTAWPTARSALLLPLRRKASKPFSKAIRATISKSPMCAWRRRFAGRFRIVARIRHRNRRRAS